MKTAKQMLAPVVKLAGERETGSGNNTTVNKYWNAVGSAYCGFTIWYADRVSGAPHILDGCQNPAYCRTFGEWMTAKGWRLKDNSKAQAGDIAFYCEYNAKENRWMYQHTFFIFEKVSGTTFITLEGNTMVYATAEEAKASTAGSGKYEGIGYKKRSMPTSGTWAIFHPNYGATKPKRTATVTVPYLEYGDAGNAVKALQGALIALGYDCGKAGADGDFGNGTKSAVIKYQQNNKLSADGVVGKDTWTKLFNN